MKKYIVIIICAFLAIMAIYIYQKNLDGQITEENTTSVVETTSIVEENTTVGEEITTTTVEETSVIEETTTVIEEQTTSAAEETETITEEKHPGDVNTLIEILELEYPENALAVLINDPSEELLDKVGDYGIFTSSKDEPPSLIIPIYVGSTVSVNEITDITSDGELIFGDRLVTDPDVGDNYSLLFEAIRAEGIPAYVIEIEFDGKSALYPYGYNGKDGNVGNEYILISENEEPVG